MTIVEAGMWCVLNLLWIGCVFLLATLFYLFGGQAAIDQVVEATGFEQSVAKSILALIIILLSLAITIGSIVVLNWVINGCGKTVNYEELMNGTHLFYTARRTEFCLTLESWKGGRAQGVAIDLSAELVRDQKELPVDIVTWAKTSPQTVTFQVPADCLEFGIAIVWKKGDQTIEAWSENAYMKTALIPNGRRYRCNDGVSFSNDDDFNHFVFRIEATS